MRLLLVRPPRVRKSITIGELMFCEPVGLEILYGMMKAEHEVKVLDMMVERADIVDVCREWQPDVVGLTSLCVDVRNVVEIASRIKEYDREIVTMVGGTQAFLVPSAFHHEAIDYVAQYTTSKNMRALMHHLKLGDAVPLLDGIQCRKDGYRSTGVKGYNEYLVPDITCTEEYRKHYSYFGFRPCAIIQTSQGCSKQCKFCLRWRVEGGRELPQEMGVVLDQLSRIKEPNVMIYDNDFLCDAGRLNALCDWLEENQIKKTFLCYGSVNSILKNRDSVARFAENGLAAVLVGYESFSADELVQYSKKSSPDDNCEASCFLKKIEVDAWASFIMHPDWTLNDFKAFRRYIRRLHPEISSMTPLTPFPTLPIYDEYRDRLLIDKEDYEKWSFGVVSIMPSKMSLRRYYFEILLSNLYVNLFMNNTVYLIRKFGIFSVTRLMAGSFRLMHRYILLMLRSGKQRPRHSGND